MIRLILVATVVAFGGSNALAQTATTPTTTASTTPINPAAPAKAAAGAQAADRMICEREEVLGSRLQGHRVCKTASQWAEERRAAREDVERSQTQRDACVNGRC